MKKESDLIRKVMEKLLKDTPEIEICAYKDLEIPCGQAVNCCGYNESCSMYTTHGHLAEFNRVFDLPNKEDYTALEKQLMQDEMYDRVFGK